jgi:hypothetical protein
MSILVEKDRPSGQLAWPHPPLALVTVISALLIYAVQAWLDAGQPAPSVDNDDIVRLTMVRDFLAGQAWYDNMLYRLGVDGTAMHWSRLVDAPIALLVLIGNWFAPNAGEAFAAHAWPAILFCLGLTGFAVAVRRIAPQAGLLPGIISGALGLSMAGKFETGSFDHHNVQQLLSIWLIAMACAGARPARDGWVAGILAASMLAVGIETLPLLAGFGVALGISWLFNFGHDPVFFRRFGQSLGLSALVLFVLLVPPSRYLTTSCDAYSAFHLTLAVSGGAALAALTSHILTARRFGERLACLALSGAVVIGLLGILFPACVSNPLGELPPLVLSQWLNHVQEAQSSFAMAQKNPWQVATVLGMAGLALSVSLWHVAANRARAAYLIMFSAIAAAFAVTLWQFRGYILLVPLSALALTAWPALMAQTAGLLPALKRALAWLSACILSWQVVAVMFMILLEPSSAPAAKPLTPVQNCLAKEAYSGLAQLEPGLVFGVTNSGPSVLAFTHHRTLAGPYHRNPQGILRSIEAMIGTPAQAQAIIREMRADLVIACVQGREDTGYAKTSPNGFMAGLLRGETPDFLEPVQASANDPLRIWRVRGRQ